MKHPKPTPSRLDMRFNPMADDEDICIPVRAGHVIEILPRHPAAGCNDEVYMDDLENHKLDMRYDPLANGEDFFIPVRAT